LPCAAIAAEEFLKEGHVAWSGAGVLQNLDNGRRRVCIEELFVVKEFTLNRCPLIGRTDDDS